MVPDSAREPALGARCRQRWLLLPLLPGFSTRYVVLAQPVLGALFASVGRIPRCCRTRPTKAQRAERDYIFPSVCWRRSSHFYDTSRDGRHVYGSWPGRRHGPERYCLDADCNVLGQHEEAAEAEHSLMCVNLGIETVQQRGSVFFIIIFFFFQTF